MPTPGAPVAPLRSLPLGPPVAPVEPSPPVTPVAPVPPAVPGAALVEPALPLLAPPEPLPLLPVLPLPLMPPVPVTPLLPGLTPGPVQSVEFVVLPLLVVPWLPVLPPLWLPVVAPPWLPLLIPLPGCSFRAVDAGLLDGPAPLFGLAHADPTRLAATTHASAEYLSHRWSIVIGAISPAQASQFLARLRTMYAARATEATD